MWSLLFLILTLSVQASSVSARESVSGSALQATADSNQRLLLDLSWVPQNCRGLLDLELKENGMRAFRDRAADIIKHTAFTEIPHKRKVLVEAIAKLDAQILQSEQVVQKLSSKARAEALMAESFMRQMRELEKEDMAERREGMNRPIDRYRLIQTSLERADSMLVVFGGDELLASRIRSRRRNLTDEGAQLIKRGDPLLIKWLKLNDEVNKFEALKAFQAAEQQARTAQFQRGMRESDLAEIDRRYAANEVYSDAYRIVPNRDGELESEALAIEQAEKEREDQMTALNEKYEEWGKAANWTMDDDELQAIQEIAKKKVADERTALSGKDYEAIRQRAKRRSKISKERRYVEIWTFGRGVRAIVSQNRGFNYEFHLDSNCRILRVISRETDSPGDVHIYNRTACLRRKDGKEVGCSRYLPFFAK